MPTIVTRGVLSARAAGAFSAAPPPPPPPPPGPPPPPPPPPPPGPPPPAPVYQEAFFSGSDSWTCPAGVFYLDTLEVAGGMYYSTPDTWQYTTSIYAFYSEYGTPPAGTSGSFTYEQAGSIADSALSSFNSGGTGERNVSIGPYRNYYVAPGTFGTVFEDFQTYRVRGLASRASGPWDNRSGQLVRGINDGWYIGVEVLYPGSSGNGESSSAFGYTAAGATSPGQQNVNVQYYVSVTPGQTYYINVGFEGGYVVLRYIQP